MKKEMSPKKIVLLTFLITSFLFIFTTGYSLLVDLIRKEYRFMYYSHDWDNTAIKIMDKKTPYEQLIDDFLKKEYINKIFVYKVEDTILLVTEHEIFGMNCFYVDIKKSEYQAFPEMVKNDIFYPQSF